jgi:hypothetical protein
LAPGLEQLAGDQAFGRLCDKIHKADSTNNVGEPYEQWEGDDKPGFIPHDPTAVDQNSIANERLQRNIDGLFTRGE